MTEATTYPDPAADQPAGTAAGRRGGTLYFGVTLVSQALALLRYVLLARLLGPEQLGLAATLVVTATFFDAISDTGAERFLIQDRDGGTPQVQGLVQTLTVARGVLNWALLLVFCIPAAWFYHTPRLAGGLALLALAPLITGFQHLDNRRAQREHDFRPEAISNGCSEVASFCAIVIAAWITRDFTAVIYGFVARALALVVTSHLQAKRPYRLGWDRRHRSRLLRFALPLMLNGLFVFLVSQGDRMLVGNRFGPTALGYYSAVMLLVYYPTAILGRYVGTMYVPLIAAQRDSDSGRERVIDHMGDQTMLLAIAMAAGFAVVAPTAIPILFGARFAQSYVLVGIVGCLQTARFLITWPATVALATGRSTTVLYGNISQGLAFAGAWLGSVLSGSLIGLVGGFVVGELVAITVAVGLVNRNLRRPFLCRADLIVICGVTYALIVATDAVVADQHWLLLAGAGGVWAVWIVVLWRRQATVVRDAVDWTFAFTASLVARLQARSHPPGTP
jgi:O-antigen/teichoic acid export membrane protein